MQWDAMAWGAMAWGPMAWGLTVLGFALGALLGMWLRQLRSKPKLDALLARTRTLEQELGSAQTRLRVSDSKRNDFERELALEKQHGVKHREQAASALGAAQAESETQRQLAATATARADRFESELGKDLETARVQSKKLREELNQGEAARRAAVQFAEAAKAQIASAQRAQDELRGLLAGASADKEQRQKQIERMENELRDWQQKFAALGEKIKPRILEAETAVRERELARAELRRAQQEISDLRDTLRQARAGVFADRRHEEELAELAAKVREYGLDRAARGAEIERLQGELLALQAQQLRAN